MAQSLSTAGLDWRIEYLLRTFVSSKAHTIFTFLFGIGIALMLESAGRNGVSLQLRRLWLLFILGAFHFSFVYHGDVLHRYALFGLLLLLIRDRFSPGLLCTVGLLVAIFGKLLYEERLFLAGLFGIQADVQEMAAASGHRVAGRVSAMSEGVRGFLSYNVAMARYWLENGWQYLAVNLHLFGRVLLGYSIWRLGILQRLFACPLTDLLKIAVYLGLASLLLIAAEMKFEGGSVGSAEHAGYNFLRHIEFLIMSAAYLVVILLLVRKGSLKTAQRALSAVGKMSLSNYLLQSVGMVALFYGAGFGVGGQIGTFSVTVLALVFFSGQAAISVIWLGRYSQGPVEYVWRRLTYRSREFVSSNTEN